MGKEVKFQSAARTVASDVPFQRNMQNVVGRSNLQPTQPAHSVPETPYPYHQTAQEAQQVPAVHPTNGAFIPTPQSVAVNASTQQATPLQPTDYYIPFPLPMLPGAGIIGLVPRLGTIVKFPLLLYRRGRPGQAIQVGVLHIENTVTPGAPIELKARLGEQLVRFWMQLGYEDLIVHLPNWPGRILPKLLPWNHTPGKSLHQYIEGGLSILHSYTVEYARPTDPPHNPAPPTSSHPRAPVFHPAVSEPAPRANAEDRLEVIQPQPPLPAPNNTNGHTIAHAGDSQQFVCSQSSLDNARPGFHRIPEGSTPLSVGIELKAPLSALRTTLWMNHIDGERLISRPNPSTDSDRDRMLALPAEQFVPDVELEVLHTVAGAPLADAYPNSHA